jgi:Flp pilus assembly protein TadG
MKISSFLRGQAMVLTRGLNRAAGSKRTSGAARCCGESVRAHLRAGDEGNTIIETALVLPILLSVVTGIFVVGVLYNNYLMLTQAVGSGAQYLQTLSTSPSGTDPCALTYAYITGAAPNLTPASISLTFTLNGVVTSGNSCAGGWANLQVPGATVTVQATYPCNLVIMGVNFAPGGCHLQAKSSQILY